METSKITVTTNVNDADLNDIHIHVVLSGRTGEALSQPVYVVGQVTLNRDTNRYEVQADDYVNVNVVKLESHDDARHALDEVTNYLIEFAIAKGLAGAQSLRLLQKG